MTPTRRGTTWWGVKLRVGRRSVLLEVRPSKPWWAYESFRELSYPVEYGVGLAFTRHPMEW